MHDTNSGYVKTERETGIELLRLVCIFGIVCMHLFGQFRADAAGVNRIYGVLINVVFNTGMSIFVLISGYFGITGTLRKVFMLWCNVLFYSVLDYIVSGFVFSSWSVKELMKACLPISTGRYWFITCYMLLLVFSEYINLIPAKLEKKHFEKLLGLMLLVFSVLPSIVYFHVDEESGKCFFNMLLVYLLGRYVRLYGVEFMDNPGKWCLIGIIIGFSFDLLMSIMGGEMGCFTWFGRDCSIVTIVISLSVFLLFHKISIRSPIINSLAKSVIAVYLFEGTIRKIVQIYIPSYESINVWLPVLITLMALGIVATCFIADKTCSKIVGSISNSVFAVFEKVFSNIGKIQ